MVIAPIFCCLRVDISSPADEWVISARPPKTPPYDGVKKGCVPFFGADPASRDFLIATSIRFAGAQPTAITYPQAVKFKPSFTQSSLEVYEGEATITAAFATKALADTNAMSASITAQACNDTVCLPPSTMQVSLGQ